VANRLSGVFALVVCAGLAISVGLRLLATTGDHTPLTGKVVARPIDFGVATAGARLTISLPVTATDAAVRGLTAKSSCGCTVVGVLPGQLAPGETIAIPIQLTIPDEAGDFESNVEFSWSGAANPVRIAITGKVARVLPATLQMGTIDLSNPKRDGTTFRLMKVGEAVSTVRSIDYNRDFLSIERVGTSGPNADGMTDTYVCKVRDSAIEGPFAQKVTFHLADPGGRQVAMNVVGYVEGPVEPLPQRLMFGALRSGQAQSLTLACKFRKQEAMHLVRVTCSDPNVIATDGFDVESGRGQISVKAVWPGDCFSGELTIYCRAEGSDKEMVRHVPIYAVKY
jgi:Protein of unknown function (DUF1573)